MATHDSAPIEDKNDIAAFVLHGWCALLFGGLMWRWLGSALGSAESETGVGLLLLIVFAPAVACWYYGLLAACVAQGLRALRPGTAQRGRAAATILNLAVVVWGLSWFAR